MDVINRHIQRYVDTVLSLRGVFIEQLRWKISTQGGRIAARLRFWDNSLLEFKEVIVPELQLIVNREDYAFHYQDANGQIIFRYDNTPHHPEISSHPNHKHLADRIEATAAPDLTDVLREIDQIFSARG